MKKLTRKETAKISGEIRPDQCFYIDENGETKRGCRAFPFQDDSGVWVYPLKDCNSCTGDL